MSPPRALPAWRSLLYVPANVPRFVDKAHERGADAIILDLEDSVPEAEKPAARAAIEAAASKVSRAGAEVLVRINRPPDLAALDLEAAVRPGIAGILITKADSEAHLGGIEAMVARLEIERGIEPGRTLFVPLIESPLAFLSMTAIFRASARNVATALGAEDFALECDMLPDEETLLYPKQQLVIAARACGILPLGFIASIADFSDLARFRAVVERSRRFGFAGAACIHPGQVKVVNEVYGPLPGEIAQALRVLEADDAARRQGRGSASLDGKMIDVPVVERARRLLRRARPG